MVYFLPAWYNNLPAGGGFGATEAFIGGATVSEFDDTVHQLRMFLAAGESPVLLTLSYAPTLRHILHRQDLYPLDVRSAFDLIQGITMTEPAVMSFRDMINAESMEWVYNPYVVLGYRDDALKVLVSFGEGGDFLYADYYDEQYLVSSTDYYDDRGFLSSTLYYEEGVPVRQRYFDAHGRLRMEHSIVSGEVTLHGEACDVFSKAHYETLEALLAEACLLLTERLSGEDMLVIAASKQHNAIALAARHGADVVLSFFEDRYDLSDVDVLSAEVAMARLIVTDTAFTARRLQDATPADIPVYDISPFDTRLALGMSQRARTAQILLPVDTLEEPYFSRAVTQICTYLQAHERAELYAVTNDVKKTSAYIAALQRVCTEGGFDALRVEDELDRGDNEEIREEEGGFDPMRPKTRIHVRSYSSETDLIRMLADVRLIVDVSDQPLLYLQIAGISAGIPQVNYRFTRYVEHKKDGYIIENIYHLTEALDYYLTTLSNWNEALVYCVGLSREYSGDRIVARWKELVQQGE